MIMKKKLPLTCQFTKSFINSFSVVSKRFASNRNLSNNKTIFYYWLSIMYVLHKIKGEI